MVYYRKIFPYRNVIFTLLGYCVMFILYISEGTDNKSYFMITSEILSFRISTIVARNIGFYGISIASDMVTNVLGNNMVKDFYVKYFLL